LHEAGCDAYMTGSLLIKVLYKLLEGKLEKSKDKLPLVTPSDPAIQPHTNKFFMMSSDTWFTLDGDDNIPDRSHIFVAYEFSNTTTKGDLLKHFGQFGKLTVRWINDSSAFLIFYKDAVIDPTKILSTSAFKVLGYDDYKQSKPDAPANGEEYRSKKRSRDSQEEESELIPKRRKQVHKPPGSKEEASFPESCIIS